MNQPNLTSTSRRIARTRSALKLTYIGLLTVIWSTLILAIAFLSGIFLADRFGRAGEILLYTIFAPPILGLVIGNLMIGVGYVM